MHASGKADFREQIFECEIGKDITWKQWFDYVGPHPRESVVFYFWQECFHIPGLQITFGTALLLRMRVDCIPTRDIICIFILHSNHLFESVPRAGASLSLTIDPARSGRGND